MSKKHYNHVQHHGLRDVLKILLVIMCVIFMSGSAGFAEEAIEKVASEVDAEAKTEKVENSSGDFEFDEVKVTATRRESALQDTTLSISALQGEEMEKLGQTDLEDVIGFIPSLEYMDTGGPGKSRVTIRGISALDGTATVAQYFDEMPVGSFDSPDAMTYDLERIEVLRGPQGTLYGEAAMGGAVRFISNKPDPNNFASKLNFSYGCIEGGGADQSYDGMLNIPVIKDKLAFRGVFYYNDNGGWIDNTLLNEDNVNDATRAGFRLTGRMYASDDLTITGLMGHHKVDTGDLTEVVNLEEMGRLLGALAGLPATAAENAILGETDDESWHYNLTLVQTFPWADLQSSTNYFTRERSISEAQPSFLVTFGLPAAYTTIDGDSTSFVQEFRLVSSDSYTFQWVGGIFYKQMDSTNTVGLNDAVVPGFFGSSYTEETKDWAVFGEGTYFFTDKLQATLGLRYSDMETITKSTTIDTMLGSGLDGSTSKHTVAMDVWVPKFSVGYEFSDDVLTYATVSQGFRKGGFNDTSFDPTIPETYDPDTLWAYELGWKTAWVDQRIGINGAVFYNDWSDFQAFNGEAGTFFMGGIENIGDAHTMGVELEVILRPLKGLTITLGGNYTEAEMDNEFLGVDGIIKKGNRLPLVPEYTFSTALDYTFPIAGNWSGILNGSYRHIGDRYSDPLNNPIGLLPSYGLIDLRVGVEGNGWTVTLYADNVTNEEAKYGPGEWGEVAAGFQSPSDPIASYYTNQPRTIGINVSYAF